MNHHLKAPCLSTSNCNIQILVGLNLNAVVVSNAAFSNASSLVLLPFVKPAPGQVIDWGGKAQPPEHVKSSITGLMPDNQSTCYLVERVKDKEEFGARNLPRHGRSDLPIAQFTSGSAWT
jgi:hypothetical protein